MNFRPPDSYTRLNELGLIADGNSFWYDVDWCPVVRWVETDPGRLSQYETTQPISDYYMFAETGGGAPWCWHAGVPTTGDEFEIHEVDLYMYLPIAATFQQFLMRKHLEGILHCGCFDDWDLVAKNSKLLEASLPHEVLTEVRGIEERVNVALERGLANPFQWDEFVEVIGRRLGDKYVRRG